MDELWGDTYRHSCSGDPLEDPKAEMLEGAAHLAVATIRQSQSVSLLTYLIL